MERPDRFYVDLGFGLIEIPKSSILQARQVLPGGELSGDVPDESLYQISAEGDDRPIREWVERIGGAVVLVQTPTGLGSGFVINDEGYVVTNDHVIAGEHRISVTVFRDENGELARESYEKIRIVATSADLDLALLKIDDEDAGPFATVPLGDSGGLRQGETVFAIGSPMGLDRTVSEGIISVTNRVIGGRLYLQTTTQINPGNSGGPLFNLQGEVVGVNNMKIAAIGAEGLGFAIPTATLISFLDNRDAYAFDPRNPNAGFRYLSPP